MFRAAFQLLILPRHNIGSSLASIQVRAMSKTLYDFKVKNLKGEEVNLSKYKGKVVLIENVASLWGTTVRDYTQVSVDADDNDYADDNGDEYDNDDENGDDT